MTRSLQIGIGCLIAFCASSALRAHGQGNFSVSVLVDGTPVPEYCARGRVYIEALKGKEFTIRLSNPTSERVAVALSVDGRNVVDARRTTELAATKWVLAPGQTADIPGWQVSGETARKFFFTETSKGYAAWLGDTANVGTIEAVFFREKRLEPKPVAKDAPHSGSRAETAQAEAGAGPAVPPSAPAEKAPTGRQLRLHRNRRQDQVPGAVGGLRGGLDAGGAHRHPLRVPTRAGSPRRPLAAGRGAAGPGWRPRLRARVRTRPLPAPLVRAGSAVESRPRRPRGAIRP